MEGSQVLWTCEIQGVQCKVSMKNYVSPNNTARIHVWVTIFFLFFFYQQTISKKENKALPSPDDTDKVCVINVFIYTVFLLLTRNMYKLW